MLVSEPVSGSSCVSFPLIFTVACVMCFQVLRVAFIITICGAVITFICGAVIAALILILDVFCSSCGS